ncbi:unnamed protein product [Miscanthus lutarioriparius]|uniref:Peptidase A1 domain-containing protein n=1 Tax=Miscanthus lutarioriparius TaxID=422564 RepID=A0A811Q5P4_9POAL|nr:unnamed protein product [Miscanthus lutarioriparius]
MAGSWKMVVSLLLVLPLLPLASSSMVFKLGGSVYLTEHFYVTMNIGDLAKPYFLDIDTGSNLTWLECHDNNGPCNTCNKMQNSKKAPKRVPVDGILGLGRGSVDLVSQLKHSGAVSKNVIGQYLSSKGGGYLFIGEENVSSSHVTWVPMAPTAPGEPNHYSPGQATLHLDRNPIGTKPLKAIFDSGSTYTLLPENLHAQLVSALKASLSKSSLKQVSDTDTALPLCWKGPKPFKTVHDLPKEFKSLVTLKFDHGVTMTIPPENYLIITGHGNACFGILELPGFDLFVIGGISMQEQLVIYDNEKGRLAWMPSPCDKMPKSKAAIISRI